MALSQIESSAHAADLYWDGGVFDLTTPGNGASDGGNGDWNTSIKNWEASGPHVGWNSTKTAFFGGTAGTVRVTSAVTALGLTFDTGGYLIDLNGKNLTLNGGGIDVRGGGVTAVNGTSQLALGASQTWNVAVGSSLTIDGRLYSDSNANVGGTNGTIYDLALDGGGTFNFTGGTAGNPDNVSGIFTAGPGTTFISGYFNNASKAPSSTAFVVSGGGTVNWSGAGTQSGNYVYVGASTAGSLNVTGGTLTLSPAMSTVIGNNAPGLLDVSGGVLTFGSAKPIYLGSTGSGSNRGAGVITVRDNGYFTTAATTGDIQLGSTGTGTGSGTINLQGGVLFTNRKISRGTSSGGTATINFDGGVLQTAGGQALDTLIEGGVVGYVMPGGAIIETTVKPVIVAGNLLDSTPKDGVAGSLTKRGVGVLTLTGTNTYAGGTNVENGKLMLGNANATFGTGGVRVSSGATVGTNTADDVVIPNRITGQGNFEQGGGGTTTLTGINTYTGFTNINGGTLAIADPAAIGSSVAIGFGNGGTPVTLRYTGPGHTLGKEIQLLGIGTMTLDGSGTGGFVVSGPLVSQNVGNKIIALSGSGSGNVLNSVVADGSGIYPGRVTLQKSGSGTWRVNGDNAFTGGVDLLGGSLEVGSATALGSADSLAPINFNGGTLRYAIGTTTDFSKRFSTANGQKFSVDTNGQTVIFAGIGNTSATTTFNKSGPGTLIMAGNNGYGGATTISEGTLQLGNGGPTGSLAAGLSAQVINNGVLALNRSDDFIFPTPVSGTGAVAQIGAGVLTFNSSLSHTGGLTVAGGGATLPNTNTYRGGTRVIAGTLRATGARTTFGNALTGSATGLDAVTVTNNGVLTGSATAATGGTGDVVVGGTDAATFGGTITAGNGTAAADAISTLNTGNLTLKGGYGGKGVFKFATASGTTAGTATTWDLLNVGVLNLSDLSSAKRFTLTLLKPAATAFNPANNQAFQIIKAQGVTLDGVNNVGIGVNLSNLFVLDTASLGISDDHFKAVTSASGSGLSIVYMANPESAPEPTTALLFGLGALPLLTRRTRRA